MNKDLAYIMHIRDSILLIEEYVRILSKEDFMENHMVQDAVVHQIQNIGEATKKLSGSFTNLYPDVPWSEVARMRDKIVHHYFDINTDIVWDVVQHDLPTIKQVVLDYIAKNQVDAQLKAKLTAEE